MGAWEGFGGGYHRIKVRLGYIERPFLKPAMAAKTERIIQLYRNGFEVNT